MTITELRSQKPTPYPDHAIYIEHVCRQRGIEFIDLDDGFGTVLLLRWQGRTLNIAMGRACVYPINSAPSMAISLDKAFASRYLSYFSIPNLGGTFFFLDTRLGRFRKPGNELADAYRLLEAMRYVAFVKPLTGSRGDFAEIIQSRQEFDDYISRVSRIYDAIIIQRVFSGDEYRAFLIDDEIIFRTIKHTPKLVGDGVGTIATLVDRYNDSLMGSGVSPVPPKPVYINAEGSNYSSDDILEAGATLQLRGRANFSAGGSGEVMDGSTRLPNKVDEIARAAAQAIGLRVAGVDLLVSQSKMDSELDVRVIEVNGNPSIKSLETAGRVDLIEQVWHSVLRKAGFGIDV